MHIVLTISSLQAGGAERVLSTLANAWVDRGHQISLITLAAPHETPAYSLDPRVHLVQLNEKGGKGASPGVRMFQILKRTFKLRKTIKQRKPDVVISFIDIMNVGTLLATRFLRIPIVVCERTHPSYHQIPLLYQKLRRITYPWARNVISQTQDASNHFLWLPLQKRVVIPNLIKAPRLQKKESDISKPIRHIISMGRLCPNKGFQLLIEAFSELQKPHVSLKLTIYGEGEMRERLEALIQDLHLTDQVFLPGMVTDVEEALCAGDLFVFPSYYEGFPNALCEAMAVGLPVIASKCSGSVDIITDGFNGRLFEVGNKKRLKKLL
jgi:GalNAc-alpha-(1->4)-GalNAc-alpha-(1->3)-diNAcBac-PP-undecaprenol alpha-1,4-N-acetyl-D-galactosaminyltransferase